MISWNMPCSEGEGLSKVKNTSKRNNTLQKTKLLFAKKETNGRGHPEEDCLEKSRNMKRLGHLTDPPRKFFNLSVSPLCAQECC